MIDKSYIDWLYLYGMHQAAELIDSARAALYTRYDSHLDIREIIITEYKKIDD